jgi:hypothetical protein
MLVSLFALSLFAASTKVPSADESPLYNPNGRRDPFASLITPSRGRWGTGCSPGLPGFAISEVTLKGIVKTKGDYIALLVAPDGKTYFAHSGQRLYDGRILAIAGRAATLQQDADTPETRTSVKGPRLVQLSLPE